MHKHKFFYADDDVELYDITIYLTQPYYDLVHSLLADLIVDYYERNEKKTIRILDIGPGTGKELISILSRIENVQFVAVDVSARMMEAAKRKLEQHHADLKHDDKITWVNDDIRNLTANQLIASNADEQENDYFDIVISAFTLHHLTIEEKMLVYGNFFNSLKPGGLFINADLFAYGNQDISKLSDGLSKDFMRKQLTTPDEQFRHLCEKLSHSQQQEQLQKWIKHWDEENIHLPLFVHPDNNSSETHLLNSSGFINTEIIYRYLHTALACAEK